MPTARKSCSASGPATSSACARRSTSSGFNYYTPVLVKDAPEGNGIPGLNTQSLWATMHGDHPKTDIGWTVYPQGFYDILMRMAQETGDLPIEITENGASYNTAPGRDGRIRDTERIAYLRGHLRAMAHAIEDGVPIRALSLLEPARQFRVGVRLLAALRDRARGLRRRPAAHGQGLCPLVRGRRRYEPRQIGRHRLGDEGVIHDHRDPPFSRGASRHRPPSVASGRFIAFTAWVTGSTQK